MSGEEKKAIKNVEKFIYSILDGISAKDCKILLDLYNKEKEKNKHLEEENAMLKGMFKKSIKE